jgi:hypothetical protein
MAGFSVAHVFHSMEEIFLVYSSQAIVNNLGVRAMILAEFKLPLAATKFEGDYHYENVMPSMLDDDFDA